MSSFIDKVAEQVQKGRELAARGKEVAIRRSERMLKIERIKIDVTEIRKEKDQKMKALARKVYELYTQNALTSPDLIALCQDIKTLQWQIDEKWTEINNLKSEKD
jgi:hypothetical protein